MLGVCCCKFVVQPCESRWITVFLYDLTLYWTSANFEALRAPRILTVHCSLIAHPSKMCVSRIEAAEMRCT